MTHSQMLQAAILAVMQTGATSENFEICAYLYQEYAAQRFLEQQAKEQAQAEPVCGGPAL